MAESRDNFNTSRVRLEDGGDDRVVDVGGEFQYLKGAIRGMFVTCEVSQPLRFQYLKGAIRGSSLDLLCFPGSSISKPQGGY